ncbi:Uncharacterised protein [Salmonella enterica subsp. enterica]|uniref:Uncharacterized protein n=1 Tax=Salmonella enterica I TaxID=59201 RepID=A0A447U7V0_SALET|nr:Uncharacterised protein [Salmonella enterica subsp. enterica]
MPAERAACKMAQRAKQQFGAFRRAFGAQVANIVFRAQRNPDQPFRGVGDFYRAGNTQRRFHGG